MLFRALSFFVFSLSAPAVLACDVALVLAVDVSGSVDPTEYDVQMRGLAFALNDPAVAEAMVGAKAQVQLMQWSGAGRQIVSIPWRSVETYDALAAFAAEVTGVTRPWSDYATAIGEAIDVAIEDSEADLTEYYRNVVITGGGSFAVRAATFADYPDRMRQKLLREMVMQLAEND